MLGLLVAVRALGVEAGTVLVVLVGALPLTLLPAYGVLALALAVRRLRLAATAGVLVAAHLLVVAPTVTQDDVPSDGAALRVVTANLYVLNPAPLEAGRALRALQPDVLVLPELDRDGLAGLRASGLLEDLPHAVVPLDGRDETVGLLSRWPLRDVTVRRIAGRALPRATVEVGQVPVRLVAGHPLPPVPPLLPLWREALDDLADEAADVALPVVLAGDLNADRDHAVFRALLDEGLRDAHDVRGRGLARTWPAAFPLLHLDHVLVRDGVGGSLEVVRVGEADVPGSDHLAVVADLVVQPS